MLNFLRRPVTISILAIAGLIGASCSQAPADDASAPLETAVSDFIATPDYDYEAQWWSPGDGQTFPHTLDFPNKNGVLRTQLETAPLETAGHPFFEPLGPNGRGCITCHQPSDAMSLSVETIQARWNDTNGEDPLFAAYDGSNCPTQPQSEKQSHSLLLEKGLFRIERPWPPKPFLDFPASEPDFDIKVIRDPHGCNTGPLFGPDAGRISVYRRPRPAANMKYLLAVGFEYDPKQGLPLPRDPETGAIISGNLMADARASTLFEQMRDAGATHLELTSNLSPESEREIEEFLLNVYSAQQVDATGGQLDDLGAGGGPDLLATSKAGQLGSIGRAVWSEFEAWEKMSDADKAALGPDIVAWRESAARGARIFRDKMFLISDSSGINTMGFGNPVRNSCVFCHNMRQMGNDVAPGQVDLGTTNQPFADPAPDLPLFEVTCKGAPHPHYGDTILTHDPGYALTTGKCADVGKITLQSMRGLSGRPPYFASGFAKDLMAVVDYYDRRYNIGYTDQEKQDLVNLMSAL